jgi:hypothetical protein
VCISRRSWLTSAEWQLVRSEASCVLCSLIGFAWLRMSRPSRGCLDPSDGAACAAPGTGHYHLVFDGALGGTMSAAFDLSVNGPDPGGPKM